MPQFTSTSQKFEPNKIHRRISTVGNLQIINLSKRLDVAHVKICEEVVSPKRVKGS